MSDTEYTEWFNPTESPVTLELNVRTPLAVPYIGRVPNPNDPATALTYEERTGNIKIVIPPKSSQKIASRFDRAIQATRCSDCATKGIRFCTGHRGAEVVAGMGPQLQRLRGGSPQPVTLAPNLTAPPPLPPVSDRLAARAARLASKAGAS